MVEKIHMVANSQPYDAIIVDSLLKIALVGLFDSYCGTVDVNFRGVRLECLTGKWLFVPHYRA